MTTVLDSEFYRLTLQSDTSVETEDHYWPAQGTMRIVTDDELVELVDPAQLPYELETDEAGIPTEEAPVADPDAPRWLYEPATEDEYLAQIEQEEKMEAAKASANAKWDMWKESVEAGEPTDWLPWFGGPTPTEVAEAEAIAKVEAEAAFAAEEEARITAEAQAQADAEAAAAAAEQAALDAEQAAIEEPAAEEIPGEAESASAGTEEEE